MKIGIAGIGGIGSNVARHLAQARVRQIMIVDYDRVEASNLNRQFYRISQAGEKKTESLAENLHEIYTGMEIEVLDLKIGPGQSEKIFSDCPVVVEGFDDKTLKKMLIEELSPTGKIILSASGIAGSDMAGVSIKKIGTCHIVGDGVSDQDEHPLFPPKIALVSALMAGIVLEYVKDQSK